MSQANTFKQDLIASTVVFLVAIPLCLGIALASNAPLFSGILAGIIGGSVIGCLSRSHVSVSGPAAGLVAVVVAAIHDLGSFEVFLMALVLSGLIQVLIGKLKAGFLADFVPSSVIQGLLCAIGILIIIKQIPFALGYFAKPQAVLNELKEVQQGIELSDFMWGLTNISLGAILICSTSLAVLFSWQKVKHPKLKMIPGPVLVVLLGIVANVLFLKYIPLLHLGSGGYLVTIPAIESFIEVKHLLTFPEISGLFNLKVYFYAFLIAVIASIETLLNLEAAEKIDVQKRYCDRNHELVAQGIGNTISGLLGGLPVTSVIVRSSVNVQSGSQTKLSAILHGMWLMLSVLLIPQVINMIPLASLAAILIFVGLKLANYKVFRRMYERGLENFIPFLITTLMIVATDLLIGVVSGLVVSAIFIMKHNSKPNFEKQLEVYPNGNVLRIKLPQQITFLNKAALIATFSDLPKNSQVLIDASHTLYMDYDIQEIITEFSQNLSKEKNISLRTKGFKKQYQQEMREDFTTITTPYAHERLKPNEVLSILEEGNKRFVNNKLLNRDISLHIEKTADANHPIAVVLSCVDSRVPVEMIFDAGVGDLFVSRVIGNVVNDDVIASLEYACHISGAKLIVVMGHTQCSAIKAACFDQLEGQLSKVSKKIKPAIDKVNTDFSHSKENEQAYLEAITGENVQFSKEQLITGSQTLSNLLNLNKIGIVGAMYDVKTGKVKFDSMPEYALVGTAIKTQKIKDRISTVLPLQEEQAI